MEQETRKNPEKNCPATKEIRRMPVYRRIMASQWMPIDGPTGRSLRSKFDFDAAFDKTCLRLLVIFSTLVSILMSNMAGLAGDDRSGVYCLLIRQVRDRGVDTRCAARDSRHLRHVDGT
jgi:hypothetical protein